MTPAVPAEAVAPAQLDGLIRQDALTLSGQLASLRARLFPPQSVKTLRRFSSGEAAALIGVTDAYLRQLSLAGQGPQPETGIGGRRSYSLAQINELRRFLSASDRRSYEPQRLPGEPLQVLAVTNFKGGSGKTTTAAHLAQYLALRGYRVLAIDLDPQSSLSALFGIQPEADLGENDTLYAALRYDDRRRPLREVIRPTYFDRLDLVPANLELQEFEHDTPRILARGTRSGESPFFARIAEVLAGIAPAYDVVVIDCPPQLGFLTLGALCAATGVIVTIHPQMLDIASMGQFLFMTSDLLEVVRSAGGRLDYRFLRYLVTRYEPQDGPQTQIVGFLRTLFGERVLTNAMLKSTAVSDAGLTKQTLYEIGRQGGARGSYARALEAMDAVNAEITDLIRQAWGRPA
ncbi:plasmid partitioning protein RepA [Siccirubricoccus sp. KC 17139]|uniref:Plasmid partitioning protein RepA n=1 Tax=Siccirubricoccus soli TaxID=2899147 RepID=A0ABT1DCY5_9PROT|nr:plasmid partitioning protein RepA [Siccirubricoccus soli]MCO6419797.1 plasmid partitioning protein RepA [Siccirubricoccus soli]MCP2685932.1 plasmid partitioning protein RepA [Siccirubricoccus soli]